MKTLAIITGLLALISFTCAISILFVPTNPNYPELHDHIFFKGIITGSGFTLLFLFFCFANKLNKEIDDEIKSN